MSEKNDGITLRTRFQRVIYFFPVQLLIAQFKKNFILLLFWGFLFGAISSNLGVGFGIPYLFLYPEFLGTVDFTSHLILGFACGGFIMAYNISTYILYGYSFPIIATLARPFFKFCVNNFIIPVTFFLSYIYFLVDFQLNSQFESTMTVSTNVLGFALGNTIFIIISLTYFFSTNRSIFEILNISEASDPEKQSKNLARGFFYKLDNASKKMHRVSEFRVETYLINPFKIGLARGSKHYETYTLQMVFSQNHINASVFETVVIATIIILGIYRDKEIFQIPAGASAMATLAMIVMAFSAIYSWLKEWSTIVLIVLILIGVYLASANIDSFNKAYGIDYKQQPTPYTSKNIYAHNNDSAQVKKDIFSHLEILENWKKKNQIIQNTEKPKLVFVNVSGGGLRSGMWSYYTLAHLDSVFDNKFLDHTHLITGSSGGMLGAAYVRELHGRRKKGKNIHLKADKYIANISKDLLNPIIFTTAVHDLYFRFDHFFREDEIRDRAYAFEKQFHKNTNFILDKKIRDYTKPEADSDIPLLILSPTILNDSRKLIIAAQPSAFLANKGGTISAQNDYTPENIEFTRFFKNHNPYDLKFSSALRMNATFPYILPNVSLPSEPLIQVLDAGIRDNFGTDITLQYLSIFKDWIKENTSGVVVVQIRDLFKNDVQKGGEPSNFRKNPSTIGTIYTNLTNTHNYSQDNAIQEIVKWTDLPIEVVSLQMKNVDEDKISLSWHLTRKEKNRIKNSMHLKENINSIIRIKELMGYD